MTNQEAWKVYLDYTRDITEFARKLAFSGIAIIWMLKAPDGSFSNLTLLSLAFVVLYLFSDITQYLIGSIRWRKWINQVEDLHFQSSGQIEGVYSPPTSLDQPVYYLFWGKVALLAIGFVTLILEIWSRFS